MQAAGVDPQHMYDEESYGFVPVLAAFAGMSYQNGSEYKLVNVTLTSPGSFDYKNRTVTISKPFINYTCSSNTSTLL